MEICFNQSEALPRSRQWRVISIEFLRSFLWRHFAGKPVVASRNVVCFLKIPTGNVNLFNINQEESLNCLSNDMIIILIRATIWVNFLLPWTRNSLLVQCILSDLLVHSTVATQRVGYLNEGLLEPRFKKSWNLQINAFCSCFHEIVHEKRCLDNSIWQTENELEHGTGGFAKHWVNCV